jgi:hypothetical protein
LWSQAQAESLADHVGGPGFAADRLPPGPLRARLEALAPAAAERASEYLRRNPLATADLRTLSITNQGHWVAICAERPQRTAGTPAVHHAGPQGAAAPNANHSKPGAANVLYIDFTGHVVTGTAWNADPDEPVASWTVPAFSMDNDRADFSTTELAFIDGVYRRVAEMFAPWDVDVTTDPAVEVSLTTGSSRIARALVTDATNSAGDAFPGIDLIDPTNSVGGIAYLGAWGGFSYNGSGNTYLGPAWVYYAAGYSEQNVALIVAHEIGHNLNLQHDRTADLGYYPGHYTGISSLTDPLSWGPIMGAPYDMNYTQWSKGEYHGAVTQSLPSQDDTAEIASRLTVRPDDVPTGTSVPLTFASPGTITPRSGRITTRADQDDYSFTAGVGALAIAVATFDERGGANAAGTLLYPAATLRDSSGTLVATSTHIAGSSTATLSTTLTTGGMFTLTVDGVGVGTPQTDPPSGFTEYGSLGTYTISGTVPTSVGVVITHAPTGVATNQSPIVFTITFSENVTGFDAADLTVTGGTAGPVTMGGSAAVYTVAVTPTAEGSVTLSVRDSAATGLVTVGATSLAATDAIIYDITSPSVVVSPASGTVNTNPTVFSLTFSEPVTGFGPTDIVPVRGTVVSVAGSGRNYTATVAMDSLTESWDWTVSPGATSDTAGNPSLAASVAVLYDVIDPTATLTLAGIDNQTATATVTLTASEAIAGLSPASFSVSGATVTGVAMVTTQTWRIDLALGRSGAVDLTLNTGGAVDLAGNPIGSAGLSFVFNAPSTSEEESQCGIGGIGLILSSLAGLVLLRRRRR